MASAEDPVRIERLLAHRQWVRRVARVLVRDEAGADDLEQQAWLAALEHPPRQDRGLRGWLGTVLRNAAWKARRSEARRSRGEGSAPPPPPVPSPADLVAEAEAHDLVVHAVLALEEPYRSTVLLRWFEDLPPSEMARRLGLPVDTVKSRLRRAHERLRTHLDGSGGGDRRRWKVVLSVLDRSGPSRPPGPMGPASGGIHGPGPAAANLAGGFLMAKKTVAMAAAVALSFALVLGWWSGSPRRTGDASIADANRSSAAEGILSSGSSLPAAEAEPDGRSGPPETPPRPPRRLTGRVVNSGGRPVPGARVTSIPDDLSTPLDPSRVKGEAGPGRFALSGEDGSFAVDLDGSTPMYAVQAEAEGYGPAMVQDLRPCAEVTLTLARPGALVGRISDLHGVPVPGARVRLAALTGSGFYAVRESVAGPSGSYRVEGVPTLPGLYSVDISAEGFATAWRVLREVAGPGEEVRCDVVLGGWGVLAGRVLDGRSGEPVAGARVVLCATPVSMGGWTRITLSGGRTVENPDAWKPLGETVSGADGSFRIDRLPPGGFNPSLQVFAGALADGWTPALAQVTLANPGEEVALDLVVWPAAVLEGRVREGDAPAAGVTVSGLVPGLESAAWFPSTYGEVSVPWTTTDVEGRYRLAGVPVRGDGACTVKAFPRDAMFRPGATVEAGAEAEVAARAGETTGVPDLVLPPFRAAAVDLLVVDAAGEPVGGAEFVAPGCPLRPRTDLTGRARLLWPPGQQGPRAVLVRARGYGAVALEVRPREAVPPEVRVVLAAGRTLRGRVQGIGPSSEGRTRVWVVNGNLPVEEATRPALAVTAGGETSPAFPPLRVYATVVPASDGTFVAEDLPEGPWFVFARRWTPSREGDAAPAVTRETPVQSVPDGRAEVVLAFLPGDEAR